MLNFNFQQKASKTPTNQIYHTKKRAASQIKYQKSPDIITQVKPLYLNNFIQPSNPHQLAFTPTNHSQILQTSKMLLPLKSKEFLNKKTLILDLDETLVHSSFIPFENNDIILNVEFENVLYNIYVLIRPGAIEFIKKVSKLYEVVIFTASISKYALPLLDILDNDKNISFRLTREHCTFLNGIYIKELKKLNRDLKDLIIVDNSPLAYSFDNDNGLPIKAWYEDKNDNELDKIYLLLEFLSKVKDVRNFIKKFVDNNEINYDLANEIIKIYNYNINEFILKKNISEKALFFNADIQESKENINNNTTKNFKEKETDELKISVKIKQCNEKQAKINNINNKENTNIINNSKKNKGILINDLVHIPTYRNQMYKGNRKEICYNSYVNSYNLRNNHNKKSGLNSKNRSKENNIKVNIQNQKKKNSFRIGTKINDKLNNNKNLTKTSNFYSKNNNLFFLNNTKFNVNNIDNDYPFSASLPKTAKNGITPKSKIHYNMNIERNIQTSKNNEHLITSKNPISNKNSAINFNSINKKYKYTNLLENLERKTIKTNCSLNNKSHFSKKSSKIKNNKSNSKNKSINTQTNSKKKLNHVGSYIVGKYRGLIINNSNYDNKFNANNNKISRSKSTGNFINFSKMIKKPKSSTGRYNFEQNFLTGTNKDFNKYSKTKSINIFDNFPKANGHKDIFHYILNDEYKTSN